MDPVREAIGQWLLADAALVALLSAPTAVFHKQALRTADFPYVLFHRQAGNERRTFGGSSGTGELWTVKGVDRNMNAENAEAIATAIRLSLEDAELVIDGKPVQSIVRETLVDYSEGDGAEIIHHAGGIYRVDVQPPT